MGRDGRRRWNHRLAEEHSIHLRFGSCVKAMDTKNKIVSDVATAAAAVRAWNALPAWQKKSAKFSAKKFFRHEMKKAKEAIEKAEKAAKYAKEHPVKAAKKAS